MSVEKHTKKIEILSRLIKESSLTLEEALILLETDEQPVLDPNRLFGPHPLRPHTPWPNPYPGPAPYKGLNPIIYNNTGTSSVPLNTISTNASI